MTALIKQKPSKSVVRHADYLIVVLIGSGYYHGNLSEVIKLYLVFKQSNSDYLEF